ncbi:putative secreted hydrolase [Hasllibacter halocynthiae]|uniref:Putative secreted hydrolase n=1 Tax=Hasllibacter halocynthiae TaxID=595589 RepID=A0A2T0X972_9RHOB|nr:lipocalin-like domain-containing protein [Hasllibacter halocynthiae]PRY95477.1 putative secreted hydrolase [Hasllibacter halocynthiae]
MRLICLLVLLPATSLAQGFAGLGTDAEGFALPDPDYAIAFPRDHGPHSDYRIEWWYVTATLTGEDGRDYGVQWTLFRSALAPGEADAQVWMGHAGITTPERHFAAERFARGGVGLAGVEAEPFRAWIDEWSMEGPSLSDVTMTARGPEAGFALDLVAEGPFVLQGALGYSVKSAEGQASHYYSQPFYRAEGVIDLPSGPVAVAGDAWLDREWSSQPLSEGQTGWDWFSLSFEGGERMMGFRLRGGGDYTSATWIEADGTPTPYGDGALRVTPLRVAEVAGRDVPVEWRVELPAEGVDVRTVPLNEDAWMGVSVPYWEGPLRFEGTHEGRGYLEMTGYE